MGDMKANVEDRAYYEVQYWGPDPYAPGSHVPGNGVWMTSVTDIYEYEHAEKMAEGLSITYRKVRILHVTVQAKVHKEYE